MTKEQVQMLRDLGFSEEAIIDRILGEKPDPQPDPQPDPEKPDTVKENQDKILAAIEKLTGAVLNHNVLSNGRDNDDQLDVDKILGDMFRGEPK